MRSCDTISAWDPGADADLASLHLRAAAFVLDAAILAVVALTIGSFGVASGVSVGSALPVMFAISAVYHIGFVAAHRRRIPPSCAFCFTLPSAPCSRSAQSPTSPRCSPTSSGAFPDRIGHVVVRQTREERGS